jgi:ferredoxin
LNELLRWNQIGTAEQIMRVGIACPQELARAHECRKPFPDEFVAGEKAEPVSNASVDEVMAKDLGGRLAYWMGEFDRCIKCYGCRDVCPVCFCNVCTLEEDKLIKTEICLRKIPCSTLPALFTWLEDVSTVICAQRSVPQIFL